MEVKVSFNQSRNFDSTIKSVCMYIEPVTCDGKGNNRLVFGSGFLLLTKPGHVSLMYRLVSVLAKLLLFKLITMSLSVYFYQKLYLAYRLTVRTILCSPIYFSPPNFPTCGPVSFFINRFV